MHAFRPLLALAALTVLAACDPPVPDSSTVIRGPGFDSPSEVARREAARREAALRRGTPTPSQTILPPTTPPGPVVVSGAPVAPQTEAERLAAETRAALGVPPAQPPVAVTTTTAPLNTAPAPLPGTATGGTTQVDLDRDNPGISREQDFGAVSAERSIEADAARVNAARQQFQIVQPRELERPDETGPNIISYALERARPVGASGSFRRSVTASERAANLRCQGYRTADVAQEEFLSAGGPERDRLGLDPDGDGNACTWNPENLRNLVRN